MGLLAKIKQDAEKSGQNKGKFIYFREGEKKRIRFLNDMEEGFEIPFHDSFTEGINVPCQEVFGRNCEYCDKEGLRTRSQYVWSVWDYDAKEVKIFMFAMNNCSPLGAIAAMYETYGTLCDRDFVISVSGKGTNKTYSVVPMDKNSFKNGKAKPYSKQAFLKILDKAYPNENNVGNEDDDEVEALETDYTNMSAKELYQACVDKGIEAEKRQKSEYYINLLQESESEDAEEADEDWGEDAEEQGNEYEDMTAKELYQLCKERDIKAEPKKPEKYYINLLQESDKANEDWQEDDGDEWE